jgi:hypothetical protein
MKALRFIKEFFQSKHIRLALVAGASIISLAYVSKRVLAEPMDSIYFTFPALVVVAAEGAIGTKKKARYTRPVFWLILIALVTIAVIALHLI